MTTEEAELRKAMGDFAYDEWQREEAALKAHPLPAQPVEPREKEYDYTDDIAARRRRGDLSS